MFEFEHLNVYFKQELLPKSRLALKHIVLVQLCKLSHTDSSGCPCICWNKPLVDFWRELQ